MILIYNIGLRLYFFSIYIASFFNDKAKLWINGRKNQQVITMSGCTWFHFASLGEFEQGHPVLKEMRAAHPEKKIVITFFSPSGYEARKGTPLADAVYYLPLDTASNSKKFVETLKPGMAIFTKYEYWFYYFYELNMQKIPLYVISAIFRPEQFFFKWYGTLHRSILSFVTHFFLQDQPSQLLLKDIGIVNVSISGDTRFDRVWANALQSKEITGIAEFKNGQKVFIAGSCWPQDEVLLAKLPNLYPGWRFIFAPHEISEDKVISLIDLFPQNKTIRYSQLINIRSEREGIRSSATNTNLPVAANQVKIIPVAPTVLIIDNIGMLSSLYAYGDIAYIGGGFGAGIHNTLEAAAFGLPTIFGPKYQRFKEARELIALKAAFSITNEAELKGIIDTLVTDEAFYNDAAKKSINYVQEHTGATQTIINYINHVSFL